MKYNFNEKIDRKNNHSAKWSEMDKNFVSNDLWPMWIADMDLKTAPEVTKAMAEKAPEGIFGYVYRPDAYYRSAVGWCKDRFSWEIETKPYPYSRSSTGDISYDKTINEPLG